MNIRTTITTVGLGTVLALGMTTTATADAGSTTAPRTAKAGASDKADRAGDAKTRAGSVIATYKGKKIDLAKGWGTAKVCSEYPDLSVKCFDNDAQANADLATYKKAHPTAFKAAPKGRGDITPKNAAAGTSKAAYAAAGTPTCNFGWVCIWQDSNYNGRKLQWSEDGTKTLGQYDFRDKASSTCNNDEIGGMSLIDYRNNLPDPEIITSLGGCLRNLADHDYPGVGTGSWNDKADALKM
ncbi:peptidase inhibitor family I36 protein [Streptomyces sp. NPDC000410]|uniref:peptidase inhibitor family I36 protein n=1 Tax=Streptomyces sp. NPDC000410 TaxID=3154254 RepID=UPI0033299480